METAYMYFLSCFVIQKHSKTYYVVYCGGKRLYTPKFVEHRVQYLDYLYRMLYAGFA